MDRELTGQARPLRGSAPPRAALRKASGRRARVLLVDHLGSARSVLAAVLGGAGYDVVLVASGPAALAELERQGADVLLTDLYMPEMSGWDLTRLVRARAIASTRGRPLCVGLYSAVLSGVSRAQLARAQVDFAITKPGDAEAILETVERALAWAEVA
jgi:CheY-like chemotaxis protein